MTTRLLAYIPSPPRGVWHLGPLPIRAYAFFIITGIIVALLIGDRRWAARGGQRGVVYDIALWMVPFGLIGGRLYHLATDWQTYWGPGGAGLSAALRIWDGGLGIWGAVALGVVGAWIGCRRHGVPLPAFIDAVAPGVVLAQAIGRLGNYFNQELYGRETTMPWGLEIFYRRDPAGYVDVHSLDGVSTGQVALVVQPTFLYELIWNVLVFGVLLLLDRRFTLGHGRLFASYVALYCIGRFGVELLRDDTATHIAGIRINTFTSTFVFIGAVVYIILAPKGREDPELLRGRGADEDDEALESERDEDLAAVAAGTAAATAAATAAGGDEADGAEAPASAADGEDETAEAEAAAAEAADEAEESEPEVAEAEAAVAESVEEQADESESADVVEAADELEAAEAAEADAELEPADELEVADEPAMEDVDEVEAEEAEEAEPEGAEAAAPEEVDEAESEEAESDEAEAAAPEEVDEAESEVVEAEPEEAEPEEAEAAAEEPAAAEVEVDDAEPAGEVPAATQRVGHPLLGGGAGPAITEDADEADEDVVAAEPEVASVEAADAPEAEAVEEPADEGEAVETPSAADESEDAESEAEDADEAEDVVAAEPEVASVEAADAPEAEAVDEPADESEPSEAAEVESAISESGDSPPASSTPDSAGAARQRWRFRLRRQRS